MAQTNLLKLDRVQNEAVRFILGTTKDTPTETMMFMLDTHQCKPDRKWSRSKHTPVPLKFPQPTPRSCERHKGMQTGTGKSWMGQAENSIVKACQLTELKQTKEWERYPNRFRRLYETLLPENVGKHCREWPEGKTKSEIKLLVQENSKPQTP